MSYVSRQRLTHRFFVSVKLGARIRHFRDCEYALRIGACVLLFASLLVSRLAAQSSSVPYDPIYGPQFHFASPSYIYPSSYESIREVEFKNLTVNIFGRNGKPDRYPLKDGKCETDDHPGYTRVELQSVHCLRSEQAGRQHALVLYFLESVGGSSSQFGIAQVFELSGKSLRVTQQIDWDLHFEGPSFDSFDEKTNKLVIHSAHYLPGDAHCCVSAIDIVTLRWEGTRFVQTGIRTVISDEGKRAGKKLHP